MTRIRFREDADLNGFFMVLVGDDCKKAKCFSLALIAVVSPDLEKQGFLAVVFVNREYNGEQETMYPKIQNASASKN